MPDQPLLFKTQIDTLYKTGLNLLAVFSLQQLPGTIADQLQQQLRQSGQNQAQFTRLVMIGNGGADFWDQLDQFGTDGADPIDRFSLHSTQRFIDSISAENDQSLILYPQTTFTIPLQQLGRLAGWGTPSPIGNSISPTYGLWFAFRAAFLTSIRLPVSQPDPQPSPCLTCVDKPCQAACPATAVLADAAAFKLNDCISHRLTDSSTCAFSCMARLACPVGTQHRYPPAAIHRLYGASLSSIAAWQKTVKKHK